MSKPSLVDRPTRSGEQLTIQAFEDFLRKVWHDKIVFRKLDIPSPRRDPVGPSAVVDDNLP